MNEIHPSAYSSGVFQDRFVHMIEKYKNTYNKHHGIDHGLSSRP
jgi:hypothetical protein